MPRLSTLLLLTWALALAPLSRADPMRSFLPVQGKPEGIRLLEAQTGETFVTIAWSNAGLYRLSDSGAVLLPSSGDPASIRPLGSGFIAVSESHSAASEPMPAQLLGFDGRTARSRVLYEPGPQVRQLIAEPALAQDGVYVLVRYSSRDVLRKVDPNGAVRWELPLAGQARTELLPISGGVLVLRAVELNSGGKESFEWHIAAVTDSGVERWHYSYDGHQYDSFAFVPPARAVMLQHDASGYAKALQYIDVSNGQADLTPLPEGITAMRGSRAGLLLMSAAFGQPQLMLLRPDGTPAWSRLLPLNATSSGDLMDATISRSGELLLVGRDWVFAEGARDSHAVVSLLRTSAANPQSPPCMDVDLTELRALQAALSAKHGISVWRGRGIEIFNAAGCTTPGMPEQLQFLRDLTGALAPAFNSSEFILVELGSGAPGYSFRYGNRSYADGYSTCCWGPCEVWGLLHYEAHHASGDAFGRHLQVQVLPQVRAITAQRERFKELTGEELQLAKNWGMPLSDRSLLATIQRTAAMLIRELEQLPRGYLRDYYNKRIAEQTEQRTLVLYPDAFGPQDDPRPLTELRQTLRQVFDPRMPRAMTPSD